MRFQIHPPEMMEGWTDAHRAYISGLDGRVYPTRVEIDKNLLVCRRTVSDSGKLHVAWPVARHGKPVLSTCSLPEREEPYLLPVELARGKISQVRDQLGAWEIAGMTVGRDFQALHKEAHHLFAQASAAQQFPERAAKLAGAAIAKACEAAELLSRSYTRQRLAIRRRRSPQLPALLGCNLGQAAPDPAWQDCFCAAFNAAAIPVQWRFIEPVEGEYHWETNDAQIEWCQKNRLMMSAGPLLDLSPEGLPAWLWTWEHDFFNLQSFICDFVETAISRYVGKIRHWEISARANTGGALAMSEENRLSLVARTLEVARQVDDEIQLLIRVDQPWGDYQARGQHRLSPVQFVDALLRSGIGLSGVNLEVAVGYRPRGSASRDLLDFSRMIDQWGYLGVPLFVTLAFPSSKNGDPNAKRDLEVDADHWRLPWSDAAQAEWVDQFLPLLMAKQAVVGIYWSHFSDAVPHDYPNAGLVNSAGGAKPALEHIIKYREAYWAADA
jgi:hypothetical protein